MFASARDDGYTVYNDVCRIAISAYYIASSSTNIRHGAIMVNGYGSSHLWPDAIFVMVYAVHFTTAVCYSITTSCFI